VTEWRDTEGNFPLDGGSHDRREKWLQWGMKTRSRDRSRTAGVGSVRRPSRGFGATRRERPSELS
jgi:hypothetical protein